MNTEKKISRRDVLKLAAAGVAAAAGVKAVNMAQASATTTEGGRKWAMVIDQSKCTGCGYCVMACRAHNDVNPEITWNPVLEGEEVNGKKTFIPRPCMHCAKAPCVDVCMVGANTYRPDGIVMMDYNKCIGCRYCEAACPYQARSFNWNAFDGENPAVPEWGQPEVARRPRGVPEKCSFCYQRIDRGLELGLKPGIDPDASPACVAACPTKARHFGDLNDPESNVSKLLAENPHFQLREDLGTGPRVYYLPVKQEA